MHLVKQKGNIKPETKLPPVYFFSIWSLFSPDRKVETKNMPRRIKLTDLE